MGGRERWGGKDRRQRLSAGTCRQVITGKVPLAAESSPVPPSAWDEETKRMHLGHQWADVAHDSSRAASSSACLLDTEAQILCYGT